MVYDALSHVKAHYSLLNRRERIETGEQQAKPLAIIITPSLTGGRGLKRLFVHLDKERLLLLPP